MDTIITILRELGLPVATIVSVIVFYCMTRRDIRKLSLDVLQLKVTNKELPSYARIAAYDEYKRRGGNSWLDYYVKNEQILEPKEHSINNNHHSA